VIDYDLGIGILWYFAFLLSVVMHEASHAFVAMKLGDRTAYEGGQVTLDPLPHIKREPIGTVAVPLFTFLTAGWMIGWASAPYDRQWARTYPQRSAWMALAGPASNLAMVLLCALLIRLGMIFDLFYAPESITFSRITASYHDGTPAGLATLLSILFSLNLILFVFNLLPIPPLDGSGAIPLLLSRKNSHRYMDFLENTPMLYLGLFLAWKVFDQVFDPIHLLFVNLLYPGIGYH